MRDQLEATRLCAIVQAPERAVLIQRAVAAAEGGIRLLALPVSIPFVAEIAAEVSDLTDAVVGLCDVARHDQLNVAMAAGAEFVLSPVFDGELVETGRARGIEVFPSVSTPNEVYAVTRSYEGPIGILPAHGLGGPEYLRFLSTAFAGQAFFAYGGVGSDTAPQYLENGASAVIVDRGLFPRELDPESEAIISVRAEALVELCMSVVTGERQSQP